MAAANNEERALFGTAEGTWVNPTHISLWIGGVYEGSTPITTPITGIGAGDLVFLETDTLTITLPAGEMSEAFALRCLRGGVQPAQLRLHTGPPGAAGTANQLAGSGYTHAIVRRWTFA